MKRLGFLWKPCDLIILTETMPVSWVEVETWVWFLPTRVYFL